MLDRLFRNLFLRLSLRAGVRAQTDCGLRATFGTAFIQTKACRAKIGSMSTAKKSSLLHTHNPGASIAVASRSAIADITLEYSSDQTSLRVLVHIDTHIRLACRALRLRHLGRKRDWRRVTVRRGTSRPLLDRGFFFLSRYTRFTGSRGGGCCFFLSDFRKRRDFFRLMFNRWRLFRLLLLHLFYHLVSKVVFSLTCSRRGTSRLLNMRWNSVHGLVDTHLWKHAAWVAKHRCLEICIADVKASQVIHALEVRWSRPSQHRSAA